jgi:hypothetical protein
VSLEEWDRHLQRGGRLKKRSEFSVDDIESGDPMRLMPRLRQIHKMGAQNVGIEDLDAHRPSHFRDTNRQWSRHAEGSRTNDESGHRTYPPSEEPQGNDGAEITDPQENEDSQEARVRQARGLKKESFGLGDLYPNAGEQVYDAPRIWKPKTKRAAGILPVMQGMVDKSTWHPDIDPALPDPFFRGELLGGGGGFLARTGREPLMPGLELAMGGDQRVEALNRQLQQERAQQYAQEIAIARDAQDALEERLGGQEKRSYRLQGHTEYQGLPIAIENRRGSVRKGKDRDGNEWRTKMKHPYGYLKGTKGADGEGVDVYVGPDKDAPNAFVVHQRDKETKKYDEDKVMLGFRSKREAKEAFLAHYDDPAFLGPIAKVSMERLRELTRQKGRLVKIARASYAALLDEIDAMGKQAAKKMTLSERIRKAGPGLGGLVGAGTGAALGAKKGKLLRGAITGLGAGATIGWTPAMSHDVLEALKGK